MGLQVALIDKSEIVKKILSHSLHYFGANVHRFETLEDFPSEADFDLVFIDWDIKIGECPLALMARAQIPKTPIVILHQNSGDSQLKQFPNVKKPMDANLIRELTAQLVPKVNQLKIHKFLKYPTAAANFEGQTPELQGENQKISEPDNLDLPELSQNEMDAIQKKGDFSLKDDPILLSENGESSLKDDPIPLSKHKKEKVMEEEISSLDLPELSEEEKTILQGEGIASNERKDSAKTAQFYEKPLLKMPKKSSEFSLNKEAQLGPASLKSIHLALEESEVEYQKEAQPAGAAALQKEGFFFR